MPAPPSEPVEIVIPDTIGVGDYQLCSPYWVGNFFCYDLHVRLPDAPWYVTAGEGGVVLQDADSTSQKLWSEAVRIAFWFEELLLIETGDATILARSGSDVRREWVVTEGRLLDAGRIGNSIKALVAQGGETRLVDVDRSDADALGPAVDEARLAGSFAVLRTSRNRIETRSTADGSIVWVLDIDPNEMITSVANHELRLDRGILSSDDSPVSFWQFLETRIVDLVTGEVVDESAASWPFRSRAMR